MIPRYTRPAMGRIWEDQNKYQRWLDVELAVTGTLAVKGIVPKDAAAEIKAKANFSVDRINQIELETKHDVIAFTTSVAEFVGPAARYFHFGLTSSDVLDTAMALQVVDASKLIASGITRLLDVLKKRALEFKTTVAVGRTHGIHAEPTTFGLKLALWYDEMRRQEARFREAAESSFLPAHLVVPERKLQSESKLDSGKPRKPCASANSPVRSAPSPTCRRRSKR